MFCHIPDFKEYLIIVSIKDVVTYASGRIISLTPMFGILDSINTIMVKYKANTIAIITKKSPHGHVIYIPGHR